MLILFLNKSNLVAEGQINENSSQWHIIMMLCLEILHILD